MISKSFGGALRLDQVGLDSNFFDLGGHSLLLTEVCLRLAESVGRRVSQLAVFRHPTVAALAGHLAHGPGAPRVAAAVSVQDPTRLAADPRRRTGRFDPTASSPGRGLWRQRSRGMGR